ncbi:MAG: phosphoribosylamine--glycine ligase [Bacteroidetes bacterium]|nr:phosphoribosylamine--glycine ligase [Bacteroidota bacterium]
MRILVLGSGGREHVFIWKLSLSKHQPVLFAAPGNAGTAELATNVDLDVNDFDGIGKFCTDNQIEVLIPGSEDPLVNGIVDYFEEREELKHIFILGPNKKLAQLEGSKDFAKDFMMDNRIPTAGYRTFVRSEFPQAVDFIMQRPGPYVLKADGLAAGKGVVIVDDPEEALGYLREMMIKEKFGSATDKLIIEEFIPGIEFSLFAISDGFNYKILPVAKDYKRIGEGDTGLNTGGMGAVSPVPFVDQRVMRQAMEYIVEPTFEGFEELGEPYVGFVFFGLIKGRKSPMVIEYNVRMGDPETEVVFPLIKSDFVELIEALRDRKLDTFNLEFEDGFCTTVFTVSGGYPDEYEKGISISIGEVKDGVLFHAGTKKSGSDLVTNGGRVIASTAIADSLSDALSKSYANAEKIQFDGKYYRKDIGQDLINIIKENNA